MRCADCGEEVVRVVNHPERWGRRMTPSMDDKWAVGWDLTCRITYDPDDRYRILAADYHYVDGEEQRHFRAPT